jgi:hypothetical protein
VGLTRQPSLLAHVAVLNIQQYCKGRIAEQQKEKSSGKNASPDRRQSKKLISRFPFAETQAKAHFRLNFPAIRSYRLGGYFLLFE